MRKSLRHSSNLVSLIFINFLMYFWLIILFHLTLQVPEMLYSDIWYLLLNVQILINKQTTLREQLLYCIPNFNLTRSLHFGCPILMVYCPTGLRPLYHNTAASITFVNMAVTVMPDTLTPLLCGAVNRFRLSLNSFFNQPRKIYF